MAQQVKIKDLDINYSISHRNVKFPRLEFKTGELLLVLPKNYENYEGLLEKNKKWIYNKRRQIDFALNQSRKKKLLERSETEFKEIARSFVKRLSKDFKPQINKVFFRIMKTKWGSLSKRKNLTLNTLLRHLPTPLIEYVIYHEMAHLIEKRHNERYWKIVAEVYPDHQTIEKDLLVYWFLVQKHSENL